MTYLSYFKKNIFFLFPLFLLGTNAMSSSSEDAFDFQAEAMSASKAEKIFNEAVGLRKASLYMKAYEKFHTVDALNVQTDIAVRTLYNLGWIANKLKWYDTSAVYIFKSNEKNKDLFGMDFAPAIKALNALKMRGQVSQGTVLENFDAACVNVNWTKEFIIGNTFSILHTPHFIQLAGMITCGKGFHQPAGSFNGFSLSSLGLHLYTKMSYIDFRNSLENAALPITQEL